MVSCSQRLGRVLPQVTASGIHIMVAEQPIRLDELTSGERTRCHQFATAQRRDVWLRGRAALKMLLHHLGEHLDTTKLSFPHPRLSLTHSGTYAVAAGVAPDHFIGGIGVDLEIQQALHPEAARFFLTEEERRWFTRLRSNLKARELLRLWTVKEAVLKADVNNEGRMLADYRLAVPGVRSGVASVIDLRSFRSFHYTSIGLQQGFFSIAVRQDKEDAPWSTN